MITKASADYPDIKFRIFDASCGLDGLGEKYDIIFSNACIQWIPNHRFLIPSMMDSLNSNGILAVQIPVNQKEPINEIIQDVASGTKWKEKLGVRVREFHTLAENGYYDILSALTNDFNIWKTTYFHVMDSHEAIIEWYKSTGLRPYLSLLDENEQNDFIADILAPLIKAYPESADGKVIFRFRRLFFTAKKK